MNTIQTIKKAVYLVVGFIFLGLGVVGIILPLLPTTPFLLLASVCFIRGSEKFDIWFKGTSLYKNHVEEFIKTRSMTLKRKLIITLFATSVIAASFVLVDYLGVRILLVMLVLYIYYYFTYKIKTIR
ncbi:YbaN family protein [Litchfieldia salsa]|uniref:DUF454 domain-containing protein n=1 Tax=Litchfieldia salsa TaxID=930152 RepID=A0A1H0VYQ1_9BACI|nr:YbaN family protein [Litchfieldia salsa]SDP83540.1 hypothetical protein SAMN05216565_10887 [Litchfieldia salsa]